MCGQILQKSVQNYGNNTILIEFVSKNQWKFAKLHFRNHVCVGLFVKNTFPLSVKLFIAFTPHLQRNLTQKHRENLYVLPPAVKYGWEYTVCCENLLVLGRDHFEWSFLCSFVKNRSRAIILVADHFSRQTLVKKFGPRSFWVADHFSGMVLYYR